MEVEAGWKASGEVELREAESQLPIRRDSPRPRLSTVMASKDSVRVRVRLPSLLDPTFLR